MKTVILKVSHATSYMSYEALTWLGGLLPTHCGHGHC